MSFPNNVYLLAATSAFITVLATLPVWRAWCLRTGLVDDPGSRKLHDQPIPLAGGLAVMTGLAVPTIIASLWLWWQAAGRSSSQTPGGLELLDPASKHLLSYGLSRRALELAGILVGALGMLLVGYLDDKHELRPRSKF